MIQRIQTIYYALAILSLAIPMAGMTVFSIFNGDLIYEMTLFGINEPETLTYTEPLAFPDLPMVFGNLVVILLLIITIFSYRNLRRQASIGRITLLAYLALLVGFCVIAYFLSQWALLHKMAVGFGTGFYFMLPGLLFVFLGNRGVKGDRKLLDSLNRLR